MQQKSQFVCALNRDRDHYQLPLALHEAGLLAAMVTDFYAADTYRAWLPRSLRDRYAPDLPSSAARSAKTSFVLQGVAHLAGLPMDRVFPVSDALLARKAGRVAKRENAHLYCYSPYLPPDTLIPKGARRAVYEFHPLPGLLWELLEADHARYPAVAWSYAQERDQLARVKANNSWSRADVVACASSVTRKSLEHAGCDPGRISVIPYGFNVPARAVQLLDRDVPIQRSDRCEFLFVGQGVQRKGLHHLIQAWQAADFVDAQLTLVCYRIDPGIKAMISSPSIRLLSHQDDAVLDELYRGSDVFVMPSLIEGFGLVYLEALARGCHVIGTSNTGLPDLDLPSSAATILAAGDIGALANALAVWRDRWRRGLVNRDEIVNVATKRSWLDFRTAVADHARQVLTG